MEALRTLFALATSPIGRVVDVLLLFAAMEALKRLKPQTAAGAKVIQVALLALAPATLILATGGSVEEAGSTALTSFLSAAGLFEIVSGAVGRQPGESLPSAILRAFQKHPLTAAEADRIFEKVASGELTVEEGAEKLAPKNVSSDAEKDAP
jgi:hypothetical protein